MLEGLELRTKRFEQIARESFVTAADVADVLALAGGLDYRSAHALVGRAVRDLVQAGEPPSALTPARLAAAAEATLGQPVAIDEAAMEAMLAGIEEMPTEHGRWSTSARERESAAQAALLARAREFA